MLSERFSIKTNCLMNYLSDPKRLIVFVTVSFLVIFISTISYAAIGDVNNDSHVDLKDVILSLQICSGLPM